MHQIWRSQRQRRESYWVTFVVEIEMICDHEQKVTLTSTNDWCRDRASSELPPTGPADEHNRVSINQGKSTATQGLFKHLTRP